MKMTSLQQRPTPPPSTPSCPFPAVTDRTLAIASARTPEVRAALNTLPNQRYAAVIVGIESHICVTQTALDLLQAGHKVYVLADAVSSCNREEVPLALARLRAEGAVVTTSESWLYECMGDAAIAEFRAIAGLVKESKKDTAESLQALCGF